MEKGEFFAYSWNIDELQKEVTVIRIYGLNENNENTCLIINDFTPYVYLELPQNISWDITKAQLLSSKIDFLMREQKPLLKQLMYKKKLYYANISKNNDTGEYIKKVFPYLFCCFSHTEDIKQLSFRVRNPINIQGIGVIKLKIHEHNASPILQLTSLRNLPTAGWIIFSGKKVLEEEKITHCQNEYKVSWKKLQSKISNDIARPLLMGYDIEVNSSDPSTMPKASKSEDKIFQISCVFSRQGELDHEKYQKYLLTLGIPDIETLGNDIDVLMYDCEYDLLAGFTELIQEKQPNIIIGYNIFTFDIPYMIDRAKKLQCFEFNKQGMDKYGVAKERTIEWSSSAYKNQSFQFLDAEGRIFVDLLPLVRRDYKMANYQLKTIASYFLKDMTKDPLDAKGIFKCYRMGMIGDEKGKRALGVVGKYCIKDSVLVVRLFETLTTWVALCEMSKVCNVPIFSLYTQGQQLKVFSQVYKKCTNENIVVEKDGYLTQENDYYTGATVFPPKPGVYDRVVPFDFCLTSDTNISTSNGYSIPLKDITKNIKVIGLNGDTFNNYSSEGLIYKGEKQTVKIELQDGTIIKSTPDHKFMLDSGLWCRADELQDKYIKCGIEQPKDFRCEKEEKWELKIENICLNMKTQKNREYTLAFARLAGYISNKKIILQTEKDFYIFRDDYFRFFNDFNYEKLEDKLIITIEDNIKNIFTKFKPDKTFPFSVLREYYSALVSADTIDLGYFLYRRHHFLSKIHKCVKNILQYTNINYNENFLKYFSENIGFRYNINSSIRLHLILYYSKIKPYISEEEQEQNTQYTYNIFNSIFNDIPVFKKKVVNIVQDEIQPVYDILNVDTVHNFIANGVVASNCSLYPTTIIAYNICWSTLVNDDNISDYECHVMSWDDHIGCEHDPKEIRKKEINEIIKKGEDEIKIIRKERDLKTNKNKKDYYTNIIEEKKEKLKPYREERSEIQKSKPKHIICATRKYRWLKKPMGVLPEILTHLLDTRTLTKKEMKNVKSKLKEMNKETDEYYQTSTYIDVLDQRQLALKISSNSCYGALGVRKGYLPFMPGAMCTTHMGRKAIEKAASVIQKQHGGVLIYGDTDSNYISFPHLETASDCWDHSVKVANEVSKLYPKPMSLAFEEKIYWRFFILTKKRYMSLACERDGKVSNDISKKGVLLQRRDNCNFVRKVYADVVMMIFNKIDRDEILYYIITEINKLCSRSYSTNDFVVTKSVGDIGDLIPKEGVNAKGKPCFKIGDYTVKKLPEDEKEKERQYKLKKCEYNVCNCKNCDDDICTTCREYYLKCLPAQVQLAEKMRNRGQLVSAGTRLEYLITTNGGYNAKQYEKVESLEYFNRHSRVLGIDYYYYLEQLTNPIDQILDIIFENNKQGFTLEQYKIRLQYLKVVKEIDSLTKGKIVFEK